MMEFDSMIARSYDYNSDAMKDPRWKVLREMYELNYEWVWNETAGIPHKIHQIWLGGKLPDKFKRYTDSWQTHHPEWEYRLWADEDIYELDLTVEQVAIFNSIQNPGQRSDYMRYHILNQYGGIYADTDFECLRSFDDLCHIDFFTGIGYPRLPELYIGLIASIPHHPITEALVKGMTSVKQGGWKEIFDTTGSYYFTRTFFDVVGGFMDDVVAFPTEYFYAFPNQAGHESRNGLSYITDNSYAVHHWAVSWSKK